MDEYLLDKEEVVAESILMVAQGIVRSNSSTRRDSMSKT
jgi:hypothetical protein